MSHFAVLVVGENVDEQLAPYHEFESTGENDQYVQDIDKTEEARREYKEEHTETRFKDPDGILHDRFTPEGEWDERFVREFTPEELEKHRPMGSGCGGGICWTSTDWKDGKGYRAKVTGVLPEGWTEVEVPTKDCMTFSEFVVDNYGYKPVPFGEEPDTNETHKYGYYLLDANGDVTKVVDRTNPNRKWDWYSVGGRWNGFFKMKPQAVGVLGKGSALSAFDPDYEPPAPDRADIAVKGDIDVEGMRDEAGESAGQRYDDFLKITAGTPQPLSWSEIQKQNTTGYDEKGEPVVDYDAARRAYHAQAMVVALRSDKAREINSDAIWWDLEDFQVSREQYVQRARNNAFSTFAVVKDGQWYERGEMGWWGVVHDEKNRDEWNLQFTALIDSLPEDTVLTVVDCHI
jgi:hypothetical protein